MIESAEEFVRLHWSENPADYRRATLDVASVEVWNDVMNRFPRMKFWVAQNKTIPLEVLRELATDPDPRVRTNVAKTRKLTDASFVQLAADPDAEVRAAVARNAQSPITLVEHLMGDDIESVRGAALLRLER